MINSKHDTDHFLFKDTFIYVQPGVCKYLSKNQRIIICKEYVIS